MKLLDKLLARFRPPRLTDPDFGELLYMHISRDPSKSYWECEWIFPPTGTPVSIGLPGTREGPLPEGRAFFLGLVNEFERIIVQVRPVLDQVFRTWLNRPLSEDMWQDVRLAGFGLDNPGATPREWDVAFETVGSKWLGITVLFVGDTPQDPVVDT